MDANKNKKWEKPKPRIVVSPNMIRTSDIIDKNGTIISHKVIKNPKDKIKQFQEIKNQE